MFLTLIALQDFFQVVIIFGRRNRSRVVGDKRMGGCRAVKYVPGASVVDVTEARESNDEGMLHGSRRTNTVPSALAVAR